MKKALLYVNGGLLDEKKLKNLLQATECIIAVDGGANYLHTLHIMPDVLIGDMDSVDQEVFDLLKQKGTKIIVYPKSKDQTDSELALSFAIEHGFQEICIVGFDGSRIDHMIATIHYLCKLVSKITIKIIQNTDDIYFVTRSLTFSGKINDEVSIIPLLSDAVGVTSTGLQYKLHDEKLSILSTRGVSNVLSDSTAAISVRKGILMVVHRHL